MSFLDDLANHMADMPGQDLAIYPMQFPSDIINCVGLFPSGGGVGGNIGIGPSYFSDQGEVNAFDYPGAQVQVRYTNPYDAYAICETIRLWLDMNPPTGYLMVKVNRSQPDDLTNNADLEMSGGPVYRFSCDFSFIKVRE